MVDQLEVIPLGGYPPEIGRWLWALQEVRQRTMRLIHDLDHRAIDWEGPDGLENAIGSLLYHIAGVEMDWLHLDIKGLTELPAAVKGDFPFAGTEPDGRRLKRVLGVPLSEHIGRLSRSREFLLREFIEISAEDWRTLRPDPLAGKYQVSPEWVVYHLVEHEAGHGSQISSLKSRYARMMGQGVE